MGKRLGRIESDDIGDAAIITRTIKDDTIYTDKILEYHGNVSCSSGGTAAVDFIVSHNLGSARIYGAQLLSHASNRGVDIHIGLVNASQISIRMVQFHSGQLVVSGLPVHAHVMV